MAETSLGEALLDCSLCRDDIAEENLVHVFGTDWSTLESGCVIFVSLANFSRTISADREPHYPWLRAILAEWHWGSIVSWRWGVSKSLRFTFSIVGNSLTLETGRLEFLLPKQCIRGEESSKPWSGSNGLERTFFNCLHVKGKGNQGGLEDRRSWGRRGIMGGCRC